MTASASTLSTSAERPSIRWWRDVVLVSATISSIVLVTWAVSGRAYLPVAVANSWVTITAFEVFQTVIALNIAKLVGRGSPARLFYLLTALGAALFVAGGILQINLAVRRPYDRAVVVGLPAKNALIAAGAVCLIIALVTSPLGLTDPRQRLRFWLDGMTVMITVVVYAAGFTGIENAGRDGGSLIERLGQAFLGPTMFLAVVLCTFKVLLGGTPIFTYPAGLLSAAAAVLEGLSMSLSRPLIAAGQIPLLLSIAVLANLALLAALRVQQLQARTDPTVWQPRVRPSLSLLPFLAVAGTYTMLIWTLATEGATTCAWIILGCALGGTVLVLIRQTTAFWDIVRLHRQVDALTAELTEARRQLAAATAVAAPLPVPSSSLRRTPQVSPLTGSPRPAGHSPLTGGLPPAGGLPPVGGQTLVPPPMGPPPRISGSAAGAAPPPVAVDPMPSPRSIRQVNPDDSEGGRHAKRG